MSERVRFDEGWMFHRGELAHPPVRRTMKIGVCGSVSDCVDDERGALAAPADAEVLAAVLPAFAVEAAPGRTLATTEWSLVDLPHDWTVDPGSILAEHEVGADPSMTWRGCLRPDVGYYRKVFRISASWLGRRVRLEFDGVMRASTTWMNGHLLGEHGSGYTPFAFDVTDIARYGDEGDNVVLVRCDTHDAEGWWGEGGGMYRHAWLVHRPPLHIDPERIHVRTTHAASATTLDVDVNVCNTAEAEATVVVEALVYDPNGIHVATAGTELLVPASGDASGTLRTTLDEAVRWDIETPNLYSVTIDIATASDIVDSATVSFGVRTASFTPDGFMLNGRRVPLRGANIHQDFGGLGIALPDRVVEHKLGLLREMGCNVIRTAHHPPASELLDACDRAGLLVIVENRHLSSTGDGLRDLEKMVVGGRNHPCVISWCLEDEELIEGTPTGARVLTTLLRHVRQLDPTRPTTVGGHNAMDDDTFYGAVDVVGYNYQSMSGLMLRHRAEHPERCMLATEDGVQPATRGIFVDDPERGHLSELGTQVGPFGRPHRPGPDAVWQFYDDNPGIAGALVWAGFDYRGEPFPLAWPCLTSSYGAMDACGNPKGYYWLLRSYFRPDAMVHIVPHWTWPGREGSDVHVPVHANSKEVEMFLNGRSLGRQSVMNHTTTWRIPYEPGTLTAVAVSDDREVARMQVRSAGRPSAVALTTSSPSLSGERADVVIVTATIVDADGIEVPRADNFVEFDTAGRGTVLGVANGDPTDVAVGRSDRCRAFSGRCTAVIRAADTSSRLTITARSPGLGSATLAIAVGHDGTTMQTEPAR